MPTSIRTLLARPAADRRRSVRRRSLLAVGALVLVAGALVGTLWFTGAFTGTRATTPTGTSPVTDPTSVTDTSPAVSDPDPAAGVAPAAADPLPDNQVLVSAPVTGGHALFAVDVDTGDHRPVTEAGPAPISPVLSPDRRTALWATDHRIEAVGVDGQGRTVLFETPIDCESPARPGWNPAAPSEIVLACTTSDGLPHLLVVDLTGTPLRSLPTGDLKAADDVAVSPDGRTLLFRGAWTTTFAADQVGSLWTVPLDGSADPVEWRGDATGGAWSSTGNVAYRTLGADGSAEVVVSAFAGTEQQSFSPAGVTDLAPAWSPDGTRLAWTRSTDLGSVLWVADAADPASARAVGGGLSVSGLVTW